MKKLISLILTFSIILSVISIPLVSQAAYTPTLTIDMSKKTGAMRHGASGFLYGLGSDGTPNVNMLTPLKPSTAVQKAPDGLQHPTGDVLDVAGTFISAGGEQVQIYLQDIYALWPYEYTGMDEYLELIKEMIPKLVLFRNSNPDYKGKIVYVPFNEPDGIWYGNIGWDSNVQNTFNQNWLTVYNLIKSLDPEALIAGTSCANYQSGHMSSWLSFCVQNNCEPDYITWHELQDYDLSSFASNLADYRSIESRVGMSEREIIINEYAPQDHCSDPGKLVNWIALFEENKVSGCLPYWHNAGNLNDIAADNNEPNGAWWLYKWYGDMSGETLSLTTNTARTDFYGLASIDDNKKSSNVLFGGVEGNGNVTLENITSTLPFENAAAVHIKVEATYWTAFHGVSNEPQVIMEGTYPVENDTVSLTFDNLFENAAYNITITPASDSFNGVIYKGEKRYTFEAEDAVYVGNAYSTNEKWTYAYSGGYRLSGIQSEADGYNLAFSVDKSGYYKMELVYSNGYGLNTENPSANATASLLATIRFDNQSEQTIPLENTLRDFMAGMYTDYVYLEKGSHIMYVRGVESNEGYFSNDCVSFTYAGGTIPEFDSVYEAELGDFNLLLNNSDTTVTTESTTKGFSGSGYITGLEERSVTEGGGVRFTVVVPDNSLYTIALRYASENDAEAAIYLDNTALDLDNILANVYLPASEAFATEYITAFLQKGINIIDIDANSAIMLDYVRVKKADSSPIEVEAESGTLSGNAEVSENAFAGGTAYVSSIEGGTEDKLTVNVTAPEDGTYKMVIRYSVSELFGAHTYNAQIVDRYASFKINNNEAKRLYFKNSYADDNWRTTVLAVELNEGNNTLEVYNDNWRLVQCGTGTTGNINYQTLVNYAPNLDLFEFYPAVAENAELTQSYKISVMSTDNGLVEFDKASVTPGENVTLTFTPEYNEGTVEVLANGEDVSSMVVDNTLTYTPVTDTHFAVNFLIPENLDNYIVNSSFGTGDFTGWEEERGSFEIIEENGIHYASVAGYLRQIIPCPEGYYDITFKAKAMESGGTLAIRTEDANLSWELTDSWNSYTVRTYSDGEINLRVIGLPAYVDDFSLNIGSVDPDLLYFVDCGDIDPTTINDGDKYGIYNSVTEQFYAEDAVTGMEWGVVDTYVPNTTYPHLSTGAETWPYEYDLTDGEDKTVTYRYAKDQDDRTGNGITYKFALPEDGDYAFEVAFYAPSHWMTSVNRKASLTMNGEVLASGIIPSTNASNPNIIKKVATVEGGYATLNLKLDSDGYGGPMMSYIRISKAPDISHMEKIDTTSLSITGSATWNNDPATQAKYAFDGDLTTFFDGISGGFLTIDLGEPTPIGAIGYYPRSSWAGRMVSTSFYGSVDGANWEQLFVITQTPPYGVETLVTHAEFLNTGEYRYIKYQNPSDYCNVAEINIYTLSDSIPFVNYDTSICRITYISIEDNSYHFTYEEGSSGTIIQVVKDGDMVTQVKTTPLTQDAVPMLSETEEIYIWDMTTMKPLVSINK